MSDFFIGQLLAAAALLPVLLRPCIRALRELKGIPLLAPIAAAVCAGTAASGFRVLFFPLFAFAIIVLGLNVPALILLIKNVQSNPYERGSAGSSALELAILAALVAACAWFQPEFSYSPQNHIKESAEQATLSAGFSYRFNVYEMEEDEAQGESPAAILYFPSFPAGKSGRETLLAMAADQGFAAVAARWSGKGIYSSSAMNPESFRNLRQVAYALGQSFQQDGTEAPYVTRFARAQEGVMQTVILDAARFARMRFSREEGKPPRIFAVAEGYACSSLAAVVASNPDLFAGAAYLLSEEDAMNLSLASAEAFRLQGLESPLPDGAAEFAQIIITDSRKGALGFAEMPAEDPALAALLRIERDRGRRLARLVAQRVLAWVEARNGRMDRQPSSSRR